MRCFFCSNKNHLSENCNIYRTLESRYLKLNYSFLPCLCKKAEWDPDDPLNLEYCGCKNFCEVCLQEHHLSLCPKRDSNHSFYSKELPDFINLFSLGYHVVKRFLTLSNPIDQLKLYLSCKYLNHLQQPLEYKMHLSFRHAQFHEKTIAVGVARIKKEDNIVPLTKNTYSSFLSIFLKDRIITKSDLQIFSKSDPIFVNFQKCKLADGLDFNVFLQSFPYLLGLKLTYSMLPKTWIKDLSNMKRSVSLRALTIYTEGEYPDINAYDLADFIRENKNLIFVIKLRYGFNFTAAWKKIEAMMKHERFAVTSNKDRCCLKFMIGFSPMMFSFNRNGLKCS